MTKLNNKQYMICSYFNCDIYDKFKSLNLQNYNDIGYIENKIRSFIYITSGDKRYLTWSIQTAINHYLNNH